MQIKNYCIPLPYLKTARNTKQSNALTELQFSSIFIITNIDEIPVYGKKILNFQRKLTLNQI